MKRVIVHSDHNGDINYYVEEGANVQLLCIDERAPNDRVYHYKSPTPTIGIDMLIAECPIGSRDDVRHEAIAARILGKPFEVVEGGRSADAKVTEPTAQQSQPSIDPNLTSHFTRRFTEVQ